MPNNKYLPPNLTFIICAIVFLAGLLLTPIIAKLYYNKLSAEFSAPAKAMATQYRQKIVAENDPYKLAKLGKIFLATENIDLAMTALQKTTTIEPEYRDGWVLRGYGELQNNQPAEALKSLLAAEAIDPIHPKTYELLAIAYSQTENEEAAKKAGEKFNYLKISN